MYNNCWGPSCRNQPPDDLAHVLHQEARIKELIIQYDIRKNRELKEQERLKAKEDKENKGKSKNSTTIGCINRK